MKNVGIRIRLEGELREAFVAVCQSEGRHASDVLRDFMRTYVKRRQPGQGDLFLGPANRSEQNKGRTALRQSRSSGGG